MRPQPLLRPVERGGHRSPRRPPAHRRQNPRAARAGPAPRAAGFRSAPISSHGNRGRAQPVARIGEAEREPDQDEGQRMLAVLAEIGMRPVARAGPASRRSTAAASSQAKRRRMVVMRAGIACSIADRISHSRELVSMPRVVNGTPQAYSGFPHAEAEHETFPDLHGIAPGGSDARLVVDAHADQRSARSPTAIDRPGARNPLRPRPRRCWSGR